ncbi:hypothetical protein CDD83_11129 [Cordyceps sp. RAO-2017]|nr:hypothetical protein CDD83_11129 [Cordyceps sp. RAO-2017]
MARFVHLVDDQSASGVVARPPVGAGAVASRRPLKPAGPHHGNDADRPVTNTVTHAFACYPIAVAIASHIDLNTLDALARACRGIHHGLIQYRHVLLSSTLRCSNEATPVNRHELLRFRARASNWHYMDDGRSSHGKSASCARDMVNECRRCGDVVCRNCAIKPPAPVALRERHRRLCVACARAPIAVLTPPPLDADTPLSSEPVQQAICSCDSKGVWLCQPCGRGIRAADHEYQRIWRWRSRYGELLGGLGTGIGDGDRGVICGREEACLAARDREQEVDGDAEDARDAETAPWSPDISSPASAMATAPSSPSSPNTAFAAAAADASVGAMPMATLLIDELRHENERTPSPQLGPGYERHEIEGIGGRVKRKRLRMVRVGACVPEWDDDGGTRVLAPEVSGRARSWCGWCCRVIPGKKDLAGEAAEPSHPPPSVRDSCVSLAR